MVASVFAADATQLLVFRILTGLGVGGMMANLNVLVSEYSSDKRRGSIMGIYTAGYPIGATIGGLVAGPLIPNFGWHSLFAIGAALTIIMLVVSWVWLPESLDYLFTRRPAGALERVNNILAKIGRPALDALPVSAAGGKEQSAIREIFTGCDPLPHHHAVGRLRHARCCLLLRQHLDPEDHCGRLGR